MIETSRRQMESIMGYACYAKSHMRSHYGKYGCFRGNGFARNPFELVAIILGFVFFWPLGLALLMWTWVRGKGNMFNWNAAPGAMPFGGSGNSAFDDWKSAELTRLEEERRKLDDAQRAFTEHLDNLRRAKDRTEFEGFMSAWRNTPKD